MAGPVMDAACITYEGISLEQDIFPRTKEPVWILGKEYITDKGKDYFSFFDDLMKTFDKILPQHSFAEEIFLFL